MADRTKIKTSEDETKVLEPASLQAALDSLMGEAVHGRAFVRCVATVATHTRARTHFPWARRMPALAPPYPPLTPSTLHCSPSGTEDVVRVYAEAETRSAADALAAKAARAAYDHAGGVGPAPEA